MLNRIKGNGLFVFSDAAGAKACLALAYILHKENKITTFKLFSNKKFSFYADWEFPVHVLDRVPEEDIKNSDFIFAGTSHPESSKGFELIAIEYAKKNKVFTASFIDHWVNFKLRFEKNGELIYPDLIFVPDQQALELGIAEKLPSEILLILENPYHTYIKDHWKAKFSKNSILHQLNVKERDAKIVLYAPDPISLVSKKRADSFDERSALNDIMEILESKKECLLIIKPHPIQPLDYLLEGIKEDKKGKTIIIAENIETLELMNSADIIIGFYSNFLIEAQLLKKKIIRYMPNENPPDLIQHLNIGHKAISKGELASELTNY